MTNNFNIKSNNIKFLTESKINIGGSFKEPIFSGNLALNNGFLNLYNNKINNKKIDVKLTNNERNWPELFWKKDKNIEIISNETIMKSFLLEEKVPNYLENLSFKNLKLKLGPDFRIQYAGIVKANLDTKLDLNFNGKVGNDLNARGLINLSKGTANLYTTPFKLCLLYTSPSPRDS